ncbi:MAG: hypothetical protein PGN27_16690 [Mycolicibacterium neoaurum]|uniref:hypothetical protein n=1 Tax=Mycolicibacterium neoaurum TaxID=1795 RepID=UPI002FF5A69C
MTMNTLLCDARVTPDGSVVVIEDVGAHGRASAYVDGTASTVDRVGSVHALWVRTLSVHEAELLSTGVRARVLVGSDTRGLGRLVFRGPLTVGSGVLAIGDARSPDRQLLFGEPATLHVSVFTETTIETIYFDHPPAEFPTSGPSVITVLIAENPGFSHAVKNTTFGRPRLPRLPKILTIRGRSPG